MPVTRHEREAAREGDAERARLHWMKLRVDNIHRHVTVFDILRRNGVELKQVTDDQTEQFSCPFHGVDRKPSARVYPESPQSPSHAWCFVCQERWDAISLWRKFNAGEDKPFSRILSEIEKFYQLTVPPIPKVAFADQEDDKAVALEDFERRIAAVERRLKQARPAYQDDMVAYLRISSVLDKLYHHILHKEEMAPAKGRRILAQIMDRIGEKERTYLKPIE